MSSQILIVDDDRTQRALLVKYVEIHFPAYDVLEAETGRDALLSLQQDSKRRIQLVLLDLEMPVLDGMETLNILREQYPALAAIIVSGSEDVEKATGALRMGAMDFIQKPVDQSRLVVSMTNALKMKSLSGEVERLSANAQNKVGFDQLIGHNQGLNEAVAIARKACASDIPVLITGETGVGKEVFARALHGESRRAGKPFIAVNCGAIPENLVESTLFGHEKGSFTGAIAKAAGKFREAQGGTIFLDEVGELPGDAQTKLLRVLQQKEVEPVGAGTPVAVDVRVISATNRQMDQEVKKGRFREDLFFRLNVLNIAIPPLRERMEDLELLAEHFISRFAAQENLAPKILHKDALKRLSVHTWPGNVRELENMLHRALVLSDNDQLTSDDFSFQVDRDRDAQSGPLSLNLVDHDGEIKNLKQCEEEIMALVVDHYDGNITRAAKELGIAKSTFYRRVGQ